MYYVQIPGRLWSSLTPVYIAYDKLSLTYRSLLRRAL